MCASDVMSSHRTTGTDLLLQTVNSGRSRSRGGGSGGQSGGGGSSNSSTVPAADTGAGLLAQNQNLLRLALKKPTEWQWELTTSSSSPNIHFPRIQLYDGASGELMVEVDRPDCVIRSNGGANPDESVTEPIARGPYRRSRTTLVKERLVTSGDSLADIFNQLHSKGLGHKLSTSRSQYRFLQKSQSTSVVVAEPECAIPRRRSRRRSVASRSSSILGRISEFYGRNGSRSSSSSSNSSNSTNSSISGCSMTQEQKRSQATPPPPPPPPPSILILPPEELMTSTGHGVTIEEVVEEPPTLAPAPTPEQATATRPKIYKLVRSNAGTLMVREESFHTQRSLRRRQRQQLATGLPQTAPAPAPAPAPTSPLQPPPPLLAATTSDREPSRYEPAINQIDRLLSQVMLRSQDLPEERRNRRGTPRTSSPAAAPPGPVHRARRRRSASVTPTNSQSISPPPSPPVRRSVVVRRSSSNSPAPSGTGDTPSRRSSRRTHQRGRRSSSREPRGASTVHDRLTCFAFTDSLF
ncbi:serine/arginine repetitive matrix protein 1 isoform X2 [Anopheles darlingi]|uniref:serine/arginine repetitive matrix protein 1 isoform X2 n=1 Tax=Anopheles darlingi TaxID=43151 RepID=UPI0021006279|nr:serine/arginine repetitive matrix protein 1 isoform X2 [Anopheles darlingi]XP_049548629.1 serine/arginine repetitive matrix protein 1 isoform X2 [Anopheles darlingi]